MRDIPVSVTVIKIASLHWRDSFVTIPEKRRELVLFPAVLFTERGPRMELLQSDSGVVQEKHERHTAENTPPGPGPSHRY